MLQGRTAITTRFVRLLVGGLVALGATAPSVDSVSAGQPPPPPVLHVDVRTNDGGAAASDFFIDVTPPNDIMPVTAGADPGDALCDLGAAGGPAPTDCAFFPLEPGDYDLRVGGVPGYVVERVTCTSLDTYPATVVTDRSVAHAPAGDPTHCIVDMTDVTQLVGVDVVVTSDDGGTAAPSGVDFRVAFVSSSGTVIIEGNDPVPGVGNEQLVVILPLGDYTVEATGPEGYELSIEITVVGTPVTATSEPALAERVTASGSISLTATQTADIVVRADDIPTAATSTTTTPTTTTTTTSTTTVAPEIAPPTTAGPTDVLPATGGRTSGMIWWALALVLVGTGARLAAGRT